MCYFENFILTNQNFNIYGFIEIYIYACIVLIDKESMQT